MLPPELAGKSDLELLRLGAREKLRLFGQYVTPAWDWTPRHIELMAKKLEAVERGGIKRLMIFLPPRSSKSENSTIHFPAWYLMRHPDKRVIVASYSADLAKTFSRRARDMVREHGKTLFDVELSEESASVDQWALKDHHGLYLAVGVGGAATGHGASLLVLDDVVKNAEEANSATYRQKVWDWWTSTAYTRLDPDGAVVLTMTRWHTDDLAGRLLAEMEAGGEQWDVVRLPALAEDTGDALGRNPGDPLWPNRYGLEEYARIRTAVGSYVWNALYQQRPMDIEGGVFKALWLRWYTSAELFRDDEGNLYYHDQLLTVYGGVDPAMSEKDSADEFAMVTIGLTPAGDCLVLDVVSGHFDPAEQPALVRQHYAKWNHKRIAVEINGGQQYLFAQLKGDVPMKAINHRTDKYSRLANMSPDVENGLLLLRESTIQEGAFVDEMRLPGRRMHPSMQGLYEQLVIYTATAAHEDRLDALEDAWSVMRMGKSTLFIPVDNAARNPFGPQRPDVVDPFPGTTSSPPVRPDVRLQAAVGEMLPRAVANRKVKESPACPDCGAAYTRRRGNAVFCPNHGWSGESGLPQEYYTNGR